MLVKILEVFPLQERQYTDRDGRSQSFKSKGFILMTTHGSLYAEAVQEWASHWEAQNLKKNHVADVALSFRCREYKDANGVVRYSNELTITNMILI